MPLVFYGGYHPRKTKHVIKGCFSGPSNLRAYIDGLGVQKTCKTGTKGVFLAMFINFGKKDDGKLRKKNMQKTRI